MKNHMYNTSAQIILSLNMHTDETVTAELAKRIKKIRTEKRLTQQHVADALQISQPAYARYEAGVRQIRVAMLSSIASALDVSVDELLGIKTTKQKPGPSPKVKKLTERITQLPKSKQSFVIEMLESYLDKAS